MFYLHICDTCIKSSKVELKYRLAVLLNLQKKCKLCI